ncbi:MAG: sugar ABC transporter substrate-binding protein [Armatimonadota bacterium]|nr:sugar ABC transporter substrate-binding protein [Armatimonadota bacterium]
MRRRRLLAVASLPLLTVALALAGGCRRARPDDGRVTIRYMAWGNPEQLQVERQITAEFEKRNPRVRVHLFMVPGSSYLDKLQLMLASRTAPDVFRVDHYNFPAIVRKEYFLPLDPLVAREPPGFLDDFTPLALEECRYEGTLYGLNVLFGAVMIYYNQDLFRQAGVPDPYQLDKEGKWTWDAFLQAARRLTRKDATGRIAQFGTTMPSFPLYASVIWNHGGEITNADLTRVVAGDDPNTVAAVQKVADLRWKWHCAPTPADAALAAFTFESGKIAMHWGWAGESPRYRKNITSFRWDLVPTPSGPRGNATVVKGNQLCINRLTRHPREAWEFVKFMTGPEAELLLCGKLRRAVPTRLSVQRHPDYLRADLPPFHTDVFLESVRRGRTLPIDWRYQEWVQMFNSATEALFNVNITDARAALADAQERANRILSGEEGF